MREDATFATPRTMPDRNAILADLSSRNLDDLREILDAVRLREQADVHDQSADDSAGTTSLEEAQPPDAPPPYTQPPRPPGIFACTYAQDRLVDAHATLYAEFDAVDPADVPRYIRDLGIIELAQRPCFLLCRGGTEPSLVVLHGIAPYQRDLEAKSKHDGDTFAFCEDADDGEHALSVAVIPSWFEKTTCHAPTTGAFEQALASDPHTRVFTTASEERVGVSKICLLPTAFAPLLLDGDVSPATAWPMLRRAAARANVTAACRPLWEWLRAVGADANNDLRVDVILPVQGDRGVKRARRLIHDALAGTAHDASIAATAPVPDTAATTATAALGELAKGIRDLSTASPKTPKTVATRWPYQLNEILRLCDVQQPENLPPVWHALAKEKRGAPARICIQVACDAMARNKGLETPTITHHIANMVCDVAFVAHDRANLLSGYSPFLFPTLTAMEAQQMAADIRMWDSHIADGGRSTVAETKQAAQLARIAPLLSFVDIFAMLCRNEVLLAVLLGEAHHVPADIGFLRSHVFRNYMAIERRMATDRRFGSQLACALRGHLAGFFQSAARDGGRPLLTRLADVVDQLELGAWQAPPLPPALETFFAPPQAPQGAPGDDAPRTEPPATPAGARRRQGQSAAQQRINNPAPVPHWSMGTRPIKPCIEAARAVGVAIPTMDTGRNACLTWHFKGFCNAACRGSAAHVQPSPAEYQRLDSFNRRFCHPHAPQPPSPLPPPATHSTYGSYEQPTLPRASTPQRARALQKTQRRTPTPPPL